ncbi:MAG: site-2 protease family protein [Thermoleophilaceae bacterium]
MFGIRIGVDPSWFFVLFLWIWLLSSSFKHVFGPGQDNKAFALATVSALLFFVSVVLHELGHAVVARRNGMQVAGVTLWMFGGVASLKGEMPSAGAEFRMAAAGPLVTLVVVAACYVLGVAVVGTDEFADAITLKRDPGASSAALLLSWLMNINLFVLAVNLIPAYPLDGGRMLRALAWWRTGDRNKATRFAARLGRGFGLLLVVAGGVWVIAGNLWGLWLALIGWMLSRWAQAEEVQGQVLSRLQGLRVADVMDTEPVAIGARTKLNQAEDEYFLRYGWAWFPVIDQPGHVLGVLTKGKVDQVPEKLRNEYTADQVMISDPGTFKVDQEAPLETLLQADGLAQLGAVMAVDAEGVLRGIVTADQVRRALRPDAASATG